MPPLPSIPDFTVARVAVPPDGLVHRLDLWNFLPFEGQQRRLDYVVLALGDRDVGIEVLIASRSPRFVDRTSPLDEHGNAHLVPAAELGLLAADLDALGFAPDGTKDAMQLLTEQLQEGRAPWQRQLVRADGQDVNFHGVFWVGGWLLVGGWLDTTIALVGRGIDVRDVELTRTSEDELERMTRP